MEEADRKKKNVNGTSRTSCSIPFCIAAADCNISTLADFRGKVIKKKERIDRVSSSWDTYC